MLFRSSDTEAQESEQYYTSSTLGSGNSGNNQMSTSAYLVAVTVTLHALLWSSSFVLVSTIYLFLSGVVGGSIQVPEILMLVSAGLTILYVVIHAITSSLQNNPVSGWAHRIVPTLRKICSVLIRTLAIIWMISCGILISVTVAKGATCPSSASSGDFVESENETSVEIQERWMYGVACILQRSGIAAGMLCFIAAITLSIIMVIALQPFSAGLFGHKQLRLPHLPHMPHKRSASAVSSTYSTHEPEFLTSALSFQCRSSALLSARSSAATTMIGSPLSPLEKQRHWQDKEQRPEASDPVSTSRFTTISKQCSFLSARPSLASIRSATAIATSPPERMNPLPPLPAYYTPPTGSLRRQRPCRRMLALTPSHYTPLQSQATAETAIIGRLKLEDQRFVSPTTNYPPVAFMNRNHPGRRSLSSIASSTYSRSVSGDGKGVTGGWGRRYSDESVATVKRSPLGIVASADEHVGPWTDVSLV